MVVLVFLVSTPYLFAQKQFKYVPQAAQKITQILAAINPKLPRDVQVRLSIPLLSRQVNTAVTNAAVRQVAAQPVVQTCIHSGQVAATNLSSYELSSEYLNGVNVLRAFHPEWRKEMLAAGLNESQIRAIEESFADTDRLLFEIDQAGNWVSPKGPEWEYNMRFLQVLTNKISLNESQVRPLLHYLYQLEDVFTWLNLQGFLLTHHGNPPRSHAYGAEGTLARQVQADLNK